MVKLTDIVASSTPKLGTITDQNIDLSTGNVFEYTPSADTTFTFSGASSGLNSFTLGVTNTNVSSGFNARGVTYPGSPQELVTEGTGAKDLVFNSDGTKLMVLFSTNNEIYSYSLTTAYDITTLNYNSAVTYASGAPGTAQTVSAMRISPDNTTVWLAFQGQLGSGSNLIREYTINAAFDTLTFVQDYSLDGFCDDITSFDFSHDGVGLFLLTKSDSGRLYFITLLTPFDISTNYTSYYQLLNNTSVSWVRVVQNSTRVFYGYSNSAIYEFSLDFDNYTYTFTNVGSDTSISGMGYVWAIEFNQYGDLLYTLESNRIRALVSGDAPAGATITYPSNVKWAGGAAPEAPGIGETDILTFLSTDGGTNFYGFQTGDAMS
jgi:hypothetical protein